MKTRARLAALLMTATAGFAAPITVGTATPALADNCEPTEPAVRLIFPTYEETILDERDNPVCYVLNGYVYPRLCDDSTTLLPGQNNPGCLLTINPDPFEPVVVQPYSPDAGRMFCTSSTFVLSTVGVSSSCTP